MVIKPATWEKDHETIASIRRQVFIEEQEVPEELEWDGKDESAIHLLAWIDGRAVATVRMLSDGHIGRMAVLKPYRNRGIGRQVVLEILNIARQAKLTEVDLDAQTHALNFYQGLGFQAEGEVFLDAGIPHRHMRLRL